jgi:hypothetical protein
MMGKLDARAWDMPTRQWISNATVSKQISNKI